MDVGVGPHRLHGHAAMVHGLEIDRHPDRGFKVRAAVLLDRHASQTDTAQLLLAKPDRRPVAKQGGFRLSQDLDDPQPLDSHTLRPRQIGPVTSCTLIVARWWSGSSARCPW